MTVAIRKIAGTDRDYLAYARKFSGRATYFVYFQDNLWGAVALHNFAPDAASRLGPTSAPSHRRAGSLPQAPRGPRTAPPVCRCHPGRRSSAPQVTMRCRQPTPIFRSPPIARSARCGSLCPTNSAMLPSPNSSNLSTCSPPRSRTAAPADCGATTPSNESVTNSTTRRRAQPLPTGTSPMTTCRSDRHPALGRHVCVRPSVRADSASRSPRHALPPAISCRESLQTGNYAHSAGFSADQIAAFPSTRSRALTPARSDREGAQSAA